jgi:hypothetical protein
VALFNGPALIEPPPPPPPPYGLFNVALGPMPFPVTEAQGGGVIYVPDTCVEDIYLYDLTCPPVTGSKTFNTIDTAVSGSPFAVITSYTCGSIGYTFDEIERRVRLRMQLQAQRAVERRVWQGQAPNQGQGPIVGLFRNATNLGSAGCVTEGFRLLEQALADNGVIGGIIHARSGMGPHLAQSHLYEYPGPGRLVTCNGTRICLGQGYDGTGPTGQAVTATTEWIYASGRVVVWQDPEIAVPPIGQTLNRSTNQIFAIAEQIYAATVECGVWAVEVTRTCATTGAT